MSLKEFIKAPFVRDEQMRARNVKLRQLEKGYLEFLRNFIIVGFLFGLSAKSGKWYMYLLAWSGMVALWGTGYSYLEEWRPNVDGLKQIWLKGIMVVLLGSLFGLVVLAISTGFQTVLNELIRAQRP
jgi:hypothetical protein